MQLPFPVSNPNLPPAVASPWVSWDVTPSPKSVKGIYLSLSDERSEESKAPRLLLATRGRTFPSLNCERKLS